MVSESSRGDILDDFPSLTALQMNSDADVWLMQCWTPRHHHRWHPPFLLVTVFMPATRIYYWDQLPSITNLQWWGISVAIIGNFVCNIKPVVTVVQSIRNSNAAIDSGFAMTCGVSHDRDYNTDKNIRRVGQTIQESTYASTQSVS